MVMASNATNCQQKNEVTNDIVIPLRTTLISLDIYEARRTPYLHQNQDENFHKVTFYTFYTTRLQTSSKAKIHNWALIYQIFDDSSNIQSQ